MPKTLFLCVNGGMSVYSEHFTKCVNDQCLSGMYNLPEMEQLGLQQQMQYIGEGRFRILGGGGKV